MGILDDAIREHLELKRRSGADAAEIERLQRTAFGDDAPAEPEPEPAAEEHAPPAEPAPAATHEPAPEPPAAAEPEPVAHEPEPVDQPTRQFTLEELEDAEQNDEPAEALTGSAPQEGEGEIDELEETPEFLQETPEHDRLWFEQKPPKDFDF